MSDIHVGSVVKLEGDDLECLTSLIETSRKAHIGFQLAITYAYQANENLFGFVHELRPELALYELAIDNKTGNIRVVGKRFD